MTTVYAIFATSPRLLRPGESPVVVVESFVADPSKGIVPVCSRNKKMVLYAVVDSVDLISPTIDEAMAEIGRLMRAS